MRSLLRMPLVVLVALVAFALPSSALAQRGGGSSRLSAFGGAPLPQGASLLHAQFGWPGISATFLYGATQKASFGGRLTFNYGMEGRVGVGGLDLGLKFQGLVRLGLIDTGKVNMGIDLEPGVALYFPGGGAFTDFGLTLPVAFVLGIPLSDALGLHATVEVPMLVTIAGYQTFYVPIYVGGGLDYALDKNLLLTLALQMGPMIDVRLNRPYFGLEALFGLAFRL